MAQLVFKSKENPAIHNGTWCNDPHTVDWLAFEGFIVHWLAFKRFVFHFSIIPRRRSPWPLVTVSPATTACPAPRDVHLLLNVLHSDVLVSPGSFAL
jgi:hypothetical protein